MKRIHSRHRDFELQVDIHYLEALKQEIDALVIDAREKGQNVIEIDTDEIFLPGNHVFAAELAEDVANRLQFCITPIKEKRDSLLTAKG